MCPPCALRLEQFIGFWEQNAPRLSAPSLQVLVYCSQSRGCWLSKPVPHLLYGLGGMWQPAMALLLVRGTERRACWRRMRRSLSLADVQCAGTRCRPFSGLGKAVSTLARTLRGQRGSWTCIAPPGNPASLQLYTWAKWSREMGFSLVIRRVFP